MARLNPYAASVKRQAIKVQQKRTASKSAAPKKAAAGGAGKEFLETLLSN